MVDWPNFGTNLASIPFVKQVNVIKMIHNWQYKHSRAIFLMSQDSTKCPMECNEAETALHHLCCNSQPGTQRPKSDLRDIRTWLRQNNTAPPLTLAVMQGIQNWISSLQPSHFPPSTNDPIERLVDMATEEQPLIRWEEVFKGRLSTKWAEAQQTWYDSLRHNHCDLETDLPRHYMGKIGSKKIIARLIYYNLNRWQIRNEVAHAIATSEAKATFS